MTSLPHVPEGQQPVMAEKPTPIPQTPQKSEEEWEKEILLEMEGARVSTDKHTLDNTFVGRNRCNILYNVCRGGKYDMVKDLVKHDRVSVNLPPNEYHCQKYNSTALHIAMWRLDFDMIAFLRRHGANMLVHNVDRDLPIHDARCIHTHNRPEGHSDLCNALAYKIGLNVLPEEKVESTIRKICQQERYDEIAMKNQMVIENLSTIMEGPTAEERETEEQSWSCFHLVCALGNETSLMALLEAFQKHHGSAMLDNKWSLRDKDGWNPLHCLVARASLFDLGKTDVNKAELQKIKRMVSKLIQVFPHFVYLCTYNRESPWRHRLAYKMWEYKDKEKSTIYRLYLHTRARVECEDVEKYEAWLWEIQSTNVCIQTNCWVMFYPRSQRKVILTSSHGSHEALSKAADTLFSKTLYMDEFHNTIRGVERPESVDPKSDAGIVFEEVSTLLSLTNPENQSLEWTPLASGAPPTTTTFTEFDFKGIHVHDGQISETYECSDARQQPVYFEHVHTNGVTLVRRCNIEGATLQLFDESYRGYNPIAWIVKYNIASLMEAPHSNESIWKQQTETHKHFAMNVIHAFLMRDNTSNEVEKTFLQAIGVWQNEGLHYLPWPPGSRHIPPANKSQSLMYVAITYQPDPQACRTMLYDLGFLGSSEEASHEEDASTDWMEENWTHVLKAPKKRHLLLALLHNTCCIGDRRAVERVIALLKTFKEWRDGAILNQFLQVQNRKLSDRKQQYAVQVAAENGNTDVLKVLSRYENVDMTVGDQLALRSAIKSGHYETAKWLVTNYTHTELTQLPSDPTGYSPEISEKEIKFCHENNLLSSVYEEMYIRKAAFWDSTQRVESKIRHGEIGRLALMLIDIQNDFFEDYSVGTETIKRGALPAKHANREYAQKVANFVKTLGPYCHSIVVARDWHPKDHSSFQTGSNNTERAIDPKTGKRQSLWPPHCIQHSEGAKVHATVQEAIDKVCAENNIEFFIVENGSTPEVDSYSTFYDKYKLVKSPMDDELKKRNIEDIVMIGIATEYCVGDSALDALSLCFDVYVVKNLCRHIKYEDGKRKLTEIRKRGGQVTTSVDFIEYMKRHEKANNQQSSQQSKSYSISQANVLKHLMGLSRVRYFAIFLHVEGDNLFDRLQSFDFGSNNEREGELFLMMTTLMNWKERPFRFRLHGIWFENFLVGEDGSGEGVKETTATMSELTQVQSGDYQNPFVPKDLKTPLATRYPLHYLMMLTKYSPSIVTQQNAQQLLISVIKFINANHMTSLDEQGYDIYRIPTFSNREEARSLQSLAIDIPPLCEAGSTSQTPLSSYESDDIFTKQCRCRCIYHAHVRQTPTDDEKRDVTMLSPFPRIPVTEKIQNIKGKCTTFHKTHVYSTSNDVHQGLDHVLHCTPLTLAVRLRLTHVVEAMLISPSDAPPVVYGKFVQGRDVNGEKFQYQSVTDLWGACLSVHNDNGTINPSHNDNVFHHLLRSMKPIDQIDHLLFTDQQVITSLECDEYVTVQKAP
eukprot:PhF_6_TR27199/c0_g2_i1/m.39977